MVRLIHTCGQVDVADHVAFTDDVVARAAPRCAAGAPVLCDSSMVAAGITAARLPAGNEVVSLVADPRAAGLAARTSNHPFGGRRGAVGRPPGRCGGGHRQRAHRAVPAAGADRRRASPAPAAVLGGPVGFVGSAQSKQELIDRPRGMSYLVVTGRRGGSAMAAAAVNAIATDRE